MCTTIRTKKLIVGLALVAATVGCSYSHVPVSIQITYDVVFWAVLPIGVNPAGDTGDVSPPKIGLRGTVMHYVPPNLASSLVL